MTRLNKHHCSKVIPDFALNIFMYIKKRKSVVGIQIIKSDNFVNNFNISPKVIYVLVNLGTHLRYD